MVTCTYQCNHLLSQTLSASHSAAVKAKEAFHERDASFSSSILSNDSVFTDSDLSGSVQTSERMVANQRLVEPSPAVGSCHARGYVNGTVAENSLRSVKEPYTTQAGQMVPKRGSTIKCSDKRSPKDSGYGSRSNTDDIQSPPASVSNKSSPASSASPLTRYNGSLASKGSQCHDNSDSELQILPLANSPVLVNRSYYQFYHIDDAYVSSTTHKRTPSVNISTVKGTTTPTQPRGKYPNQPLLPPQQPQSVHKKLVVESLKPIKSASCSSLDRLSLTSSLEEFAENLDKINVAAYESIDGDETGGPRKRLLSVTRFETLTSNLEVPQCATVVKVVAPTTSTAGTGRSETKQRNAWLRRFNIGRRRVKTTKQSTDSSRHSVGVMITPAGQAKLRRKKANRGSRRMVVSDDLTHKVCFPSNVQHSQQSTPTQTVSHSSNGADVKENACKGQQLSRTGGKQFAVSKEEDQEEKRAYEPQDYFASSIPAKLSQSIDGLADLKFLSLQLQTLAQPSQSTTNLDLSQRASETASNVALRVSQSVNDLSDAVATPLGQLAVNDDGLPREGFLWRVLGRASQRWPAFIYVAIIQNSQVGVRGFCVRKGQQVRALYRVSGQVIVETDTNHLACIPYECCRISRKLYGPRSSLVQLSYSQLYSPAPDIQPILSNKLSLCSATAAPPTARMHTPIEMVAIQDCYDFVPVGEINVDAGDKLRVLYCDEQYVYAVKENREAGLIPRSFCRLTRKSEKMYQKWVELTQTPFQADYPIKFSEKPPSFIRKLSEQGVGRSSGLTSTPRLEKNNTVPANLTANIEPPKGQSTQRENGGCVRSLSLKDVRKTLVSTSPVRRKGAPVSPLTQRRLKSPQISQRQQSGLLNAASPTTPLSHVPSSPYHAPHAQHSTSPQSAALTHFTYPLTQNRGRNESVQTTVPSKPSSASAHHTNTRSYSGKLMTVVKSYTPQTGSSANTIRKGLRVRVLQSSPNGTTLRVATKTGTQFDIPASHLCMSRKNSEPSANFENDVTIFANGSHSPTTSRQYSMTDGQGKSPVPQPLDCGKIMTVIHNFVPSVENPMCTIRKGLRVKVLGGHGDQVKVVTKTGTTFCIPRSHLRLSHKTSDASSFAAAAADTYSSIRSPPNSTSMHTNREIPPEPVYEALQDERSKVTYATVQCSPTRASAQQFGNASTLRSNSSNFKQTLRNGRQGSGTSGGGGGGGVASEVAFRGCRIGSAGSQVFELC